MWKCLLTLVFAVAVLSPGKSLAVFDVEEMEAWSSEIFVCGRIFQRLASAGVEDVAATIKEDLLRNARENGASQTQLLKLDESFEEGRTSARYDGYETGHYPREIDLDEFAEFGRRAHKNCIEWNYAGPT